MFCSFPSVHDEDNKRNDDEKFEMTMQKMQQLHKQHLEKYALSKGSDLMAGDGPSSDLQYYACCAGFQTNQDKTFCHDRLQNGNEVSSTNNLKNKGFGWPKTTQKVQNPEHCPIQPPPENVIGNISPPSLRELKETIDTLSNRPTSGDFFSRDGADVVGDVPKRKWTPHSKRWRGKLTELWHLPPDRRTQIGNIVLPCDKNAFKIAYADRDATLGFLADGTEVAVITMKRNDDVTNNFEQLLSPCYDNTFLARYKSYETDGDTCFVALELFEYTLAEYVKDPALNDQLHDLTKWTWQILKGIAALHNTCGTLHGNIMPSNTLVDVDGRIRLSAYGLSTETASEESLLWKTSFDEDRKCWISTEVTTETEQYSAKSDIQVAGMLIHYLLTRGRHPYGENSMEISLCIQQNWHHIQTQNTEANDLIYGLLSMPPTCRPQAIDSLRHPYFWAAEKKLRLVLIAGSDVLRDLKLGTSSSSGDEGKTMIEILGSAGEAEFSNFSNWTHDVDPVIMREMRAFRQYKNTLVELVLFVYNCCLHFEKLPRNACDVIDEPCRYFLGRFPALCLAVYRAIQRTDRVNKICYKPFF
ncbi:hypothetical protein FSP39_024935 [Pinctada imbricata]|uniref:Protein kinase domain-containing protein n=1 Tax=Pinctada imbricata TaxID=66713 RepID=A0AA88XSZ3_PINIB|nr:hypothetical protein FSP39_024935 [Pinctada imbricata]